MLYQLPNGKVINISVEQYLDLTDQDIQDLIAGNYGDYPTSHWQDSAINKWQKNKNKERKDIDHSIDYTEESDEIIIQTTVLTIITIDNIDSSDIPEELDSEESEDT